MNESIMNSSSSGDGLSCNNILQLFLSKPKADNNDSHCHLLQGFTQQQQHQAIVILAIVLAITVSKWITEQRQQRRGIPSSKYRLPPMAPYPFWESFKAATSGQIAWYMKSVCERMGKVCRMKFMTPMNTVYVVCDPSITREVLTDPTTLKSPRLKNFNRITAGTTQFFTSNGHRFYHARKAMAPAFAANHIKRMDKVTIQKTEDWIANRLEPTVGRNEVIDVNREMVDLTLDVILDAAFEYDMSPIQKEQLMDCIHVTLSTFIFPNPVKMMFWFLFPSMWRAHAKARQLMSIAHDIIDSYRRKDPAAVTKGTVIDLILNNPNYTNDDERAADIIDLIIAGHETSSSSMTFLLLELARNPQEQQKLQRELQQITKQEDRTNCEYLKCCIKEGLRQWPVAAPGPIRLVGRDVIVPAEEGNSKDGTDYLIPKGSLVFMPAIGLLHNAKYFEHPLDFHPSRWEHPTDEMKHAFLPFALGKRSCLGQSLANSEMQSILSRLCSQYNFELVEEGTVRFFLTLKPTGVLLKATRL